MLDGPDLPSPVSCYAEALRAFIDEALRRGDFPRVRELADKLARVAQMSNVAGARAG